MNLSLSNQLIKSGILVCIVLFGIITCIHPIFPKEQFLQHMGTALLLLIPAMDIQRNRLSLSSYLCVSAFIVIHIVGARYIYSFVPYNEWIHKGFHVDINNTFHTTRNHYDRFVHLFFGVLAFPYLYEILGRKGQLSTLMKILLAWCMIQSISMIYEIFEWSLTIIMSGESADNYNGQQGDLWDAQKDMALALAGSSAMALAHILKKIVRRQN